MFIPSMTFCLLIDIEILFQLKIYCPIAFKTTPKYCREILVIIGLISTLLSGVLILISFLAFTPITVTTQSTKFIKTFFCILLIKCICWSPFIGIEYYDTVFIVNLFYRNDQGIDNLMKLRMNIKREFLASDLFKNKILICRMK